MSIFNSINSLIQICQFAGIAPISLNQDTLKWESNQSLMGLSIVFLVYSIAIIIIVATNSSTFFDFERPEAQTGLVILLLLSSFFHSISALLEMFSKRNTQIELLNAFEMMDKSLKQYYDEHINYTALKRKCHRIIVFWICDFSSLLTSGLINAVFSNDNRSKAYIAVYIPFYMLNKLSFSYQIMLVTIIHENFKVLNKFLKSVNRKNPHYICDRFSRQKDLMQMKWNYLIQNELGLHIDALHSLKSAYSQLWTASKKVKFLCQWSLHLDLSYEFIASTFNLYYLAVIIFFVTYPLTAYILLSMSIATNLGNLIFIANHCRQIDEDVSKTKSSYTLPVKMKMIFFLFCEIVVK